MRIFETIAVLLVAAGLAACASGASRERAWSPEPPRRETMQLGAFSVSLAVKDLAASRAFYEKLGFRQIHGEPEKGWIILQNGAATIGLFQGMFERNILTFNPGWANDGRHPETFQDIREIQRALKEQGVAFATEADPDSTGPASFIVHDPDGNPVLLDQHVPRPGR